MGLRSVLYHRAPKIVQSLITRSKYAIGLRPRVNPKLPQAEEGRFPLPYKACLILSADLELAWAWRYVRGRKDPLEFAHEKAGQARENIPELLRLFDAYEVPVSWATVGHLFLETCSRNSGIAHPEVLRVPYFQNEYWSYREGDWFDSDPSSNYREVPEWYAPDLIRSILGAGVHHEIACHTFSHVDFSDQRCPAAVAESELRASVEAAKSWGIEVTSFVFPGNLVGNLPALKRYGLSCYRAEMPCELDYPQQDALGLWQIPSAVCLEKPDLNWTDAYWITILKRYVDLAIETGTVCHFWFHPSCDRVNVEVIFPAVLDYVAEHKDVLWVTTMAELSEWLAKKESIG